MKKYLYILICSFVLTSCISITFGEKEKNDSNIEVSEATTQRVDAILGAAVAFVKESEKVALEKGRELEEEEVKYALSLGIEHPEKIRIKYQFSLPRPQGAELLAEFNKLGFGSFFEGGRTNGYGIFIKSYFPNKKSIIQHELFHVKQMEDMGLKIFIKQYLKQAMTYDYFSMPIEVEAFNKTKGEKY